jgi:ornithine cyclodeaminase/alanine dehydrogenase-like protein (mu-crystallin family)
MEDEHTYRAHNGRPASPERVEIADTIVVETRSQGASAGAKDEQEFEVVAIVEDSDSTLRYAVCYCESEDEFIVTDDGGTLLKDEALAQEILEDFLEQAAGSTEEDT